MLCSDLKKYFYKIEFLLLSSNSIYTKRGHGPKIVMEEKLHAQCQMTSSVTQAHFQMSTQFWEQFKHIFIQMKEWGSSILVQTERCMILSYELAGVRH